MEFHSGWDGGGDGALLLAVGMQQGGSPRVEMGGEEWEDFLGGECGGGWEWIDGEIVEGEEEGEGGKRNEFGGE